MINCWNIFPEPDENGVVWIEDGPNRYGLTPGMTWWYGEVRESMADFWDEEGERAPILWQGSLVVGDEPKQGRIIL